MSEKYKEDTEIKKKMEHLIEKEKPPKISIGEFSTKD